MFVNVFWRVFLFFNYFKKKKIFVFLKLWLERVSKSPQIDKSVGHNFLGAKGIMQRQK
jgi:hypothetical protein